MCISFLRNGFIEPIEEHIDGVIDCIKRYFIRRGYSKRVAREFGIDEEMANKLILLTAILHDIGKANRRFQDEGRFRGHAFYSGAISLDICKFYGFPDEITSAVSLAILHHHHTMKGTKISGSFDMSERCKLVINNILTRNGFQEYEFLPLKEGEVKERVDRLKKEEPRLLKKVYLLLYPLMVCDNLAAISRNPSCCPIKGLGKELFMSYAFCDRED